jgi:hypothetical protein
MTAVVLLLAGRRALPGGSAEPGGPRPLVVLAAGTGSRRVDERSGMPAARRPGLIMSGG